MQRTATANAAGFADFIEGRFAAWSGYGCKPAARLARSASLLMNPKGDVTCVGLVRTDAMGILAALDSHAKIRALFGRALANAVG